MEYIIIAFRSRMETMRFSELLSRYNIQKEVISTPKEAHVGCGLSVKTYKRNLEKVKRILSYGGFNNFAGFFEETYLGSKRVVRSI